MYWRCTPTGARPALEVTGVVQDQHTIALNQSIPSDYSATGHLQLLRAGGPSGSAPVNPNPRKNPWQDLDALGNIAAAKVTDRSVIDSLVAHGYTDNIAVTITGTILVVTATGGSPAEASGTVAQVMRLLTEDIRKEQTPYDVADDDLITTLALDNGQRVTEVWSRAKRIDAAAGGVAVVASIAATFGLDVLLSRRARRQVGLASPISPVDGG